MKNEKQLQTYLKYKLKGLGCLVYKFASPTCRGVPDLLIIPPSGVTFYVELKSPTGKGKLSPLQEHQIALITENNADVFIVSNRFAADILIKCIEQEKL